MQQAIQYEEVPVGTVITGPVFATSRETIKEYCEASLDFNPLHLDDEFMKGSFGKTNFSGVIVHGMTTFSLITRTLVDWLEPRGGIHRRIESRWKVPVKPGDTIQPFATLKDKQVTKKGRWMTFDVEVRNQRGEVVAVAETMAEFPGNGSAAK